MTITALGAKGRLVIPVQARTEADIEIGQSVVVHADGRGRIVIESLDAVQARVWAAAPGAEAEGDIRALREEDIELSDSAAARRASSVVADHQRQEPDPTGVALLATLGL